MDESVNPENIVNPVESSELAEPMVMPLVKGPGRPHEQLSIQFRAIHHPIEGQASWVESTYIRKLDTKDEQPYTRKLKLTPAWQKLRGECWLEHVGMFVIENLSTEKTTSNIIQIGTLQTTVKRIEADWYVLAGELMSGTPVRFDRLYVRCLAREVRAMLTCYPE